MQSLQEDEESTVSCPLEFSIYYCGNFFLDSASKFFDLLIIVFAIGWGSADHREANTIRYGLFSKSLG